MNDHEIQAELERLRARRRALTELAALRSEVAVLEQGRLFAQPQHILKTAVETVCNHFDIGIEVIMGRSKRQNLCVPRWLVFYLAHEKGMSCSELGRLFDRNHSGILYAVQSILDKMDVEPEFKELVQKLEQEYCVANQSTVVPLTKSA